MGEKPNQPTEEELRLEDEGLVEDGQQFSGEKLARIAKRRAGQYEGRLAESLIAARAEIELLNIELQRAANELSLANSRDIRCARDHGGQLKT